MLDEVEEHILPLRHTDQRHPKHAIELGPYIPWSLEHVYAEAGVPNAGQIQAQFQV